MNKKRIKLHALKKKYGGFKKKKRKRKTLPVMAYLKILCGILTKSTFQCMPEVVGKEESF